ncbi:MAG TPA: formate dehydrogenase accessory sulfurtransferase FdhD [Pseudomonadales bacterium]|nr:formate dehydrogenase accessory sulfurtransferase FdhD [Pseudomonadales bacterium]
MAILLMATMRASCEVIDSSDMKEDDSLLQYNITRVGVDGDVQQGDALAVEEPLDIRLRWQRNGEWEEEPLTITMRTPGNDVELAAGLLFSEGIVRQREQILAITRGDNQNTVLVELSPDHQLDTKRFQRHFLSTSSCGVCGKMSIESLQLLHQPQLHERAPMMDAALLQTLPLLLNTAQTLFQQTGGVHAAGLFSVDGKLLLLREDVGRHNAVDKLLGACLLAQKFPTKDCMLLVSGRAGFEIVQKALTANIAFMAAVGAPTSLAVDLARTHGMTLVGFLKSSGFNCYSGEQRIKTKGA